MGGSSMTDVNRLELTNGQVNAWKAVYSNHMQGIFQLNKAPFCISVAKGFEEDLKPSEHEIVEEIDASASKEASFVNFSELEKEEQKDDLESAKLLLVAGLGVNGKEKIEELGQIAEKLHGKFGVTRPVAMNAWAPMNQLIGVSGAMVKPKICITAGISGAAAFYAGIEKSDYIISINSNEKAPIIKKADIAIIDDYEKVIKALTKMLDERTVEDGR
jgi:electron transfer flavoprotein alpha subunit